MTTSGKYMGRTWPMLMMVCVLWTMCSQAVELSAVHEKIQYHLTELKNGMQELRTSRIHKRSADPNYDEIIFRSLSSFCSQLHTNSDTGHQTGDTNPDSAPTTPDSMSYDLSDWTGPDVFPLKLEAERKGDNVSIVFHVVHTASGSVIKAGSFDYIKTLLDYPPGSSGPILSRVKIEFDASGCSKERPLEGANSHTRFDFSLTKNSQYVASAMINVCTFDVVRNASADNKRDYQSQQLQRKEGVFSEDIPVPSFTLSPDPKGEILIERGENVTLDIDVVVKGQDQFNLIARVWDKLEGKLLKSSHMVTSGENGSLVDRSMPDDLLSVEILDTVTDEDDPSILRGTVRVTVNVAGEGRSGRLDIAYTFVNYDPEDPRMVPFLQTGRKVLLKSPDTLLTLPLDVVDFANYHGSILFRCDESGNMNQERSGRNCTVMCYAMGLGMKKIVLRKASRYRAPVRYVAYVEDDIAFAMLDMGPASKAIEGKYKCVVTTSRGRKRRKDLHLYTSLFTNITQFSVKDYHNGTTRVSCMSYGEQPLNMSIYIHKDYENKGTERLDNSTDYLYLVHRKVDGNSQNLTINVRTTALREPTRYVRCGAKGQRGDEEDSIYLYGHRISRYYAKPEVERMSNATYIAKTWDSNVTVYCSVIGRPPMNISVYFESRGPKLERIDNQEGYTRTIRTWDHRTTLALTTQIEKLKEAPYGYMRCQANNEYGEDWYTFSMYDFI